MRVLDAQTLLIRKEILPEPVARFYLAQSVIAIEAVHAAKYIHRCHALARRVVPATWFACCKLLAITSDSSSCHNACSLQ